MKYASGLSVKENKLTDKERRSKIILTHLKTWVKIPTLNKSPKIKQYALPWSEAIKAGSSF